MQRSLYWLAILWMPALARASPSDAHLQPLGNSAPVAFRLSPGETREFRLPVAGGFRVELDQKDADFRLEFLDSHARLVRTIDAFGWATETATFEPDTTARFVRVRRVEHERYAAPLTIRLVELPVLSSKDLIKIQAEDAATSARALLRDAHDAASTRAAVSAAQSAAELWRDADDDEAQLRASILLADALNTAGDFAEASRRYTETLAAGRRLGDLRSEAESLNNQGVSLRRQSLFNDALKDLTEALQAWKRLPPQIGYASCLNNLALTEFEVAQYASALDHFSEALRVQNALGVHDGDPFIFNNEALVEGALGEWAASIRSFARAAAEFEARGDILAAGRALSNSARMYLRAGNPSRAEANVERGLAMVSRAGDDRARTESLNLLGEVYVERRQTDEALKTLHQALDLARKIGDLRAEANALTSIGLALSTISGQAAAVSFLENALEIFHRIGAPAPQAGVLYHLALIFRDTGETDRALDAAKQSVAIAETIRGNVTAETLRVSFLASTHNYYSALIDILMLKGLTEQAWETAERARARALLDAVGGAPARQNPVEFILSAVPSVSELRGWLGENTALIEYSVSDSGGYVWAISRESLTSFRLPTSRAIEVSAGVVASLMNSERTSFGDDLTFRRAVQSLAAALMIPALTADSGIKRLVIVSDGPLESVPFELLPARGSPALIEKYEVIDAPSAAVAVALTRRREERADYAPRGVLLLADPVFDADDARLGAQSASSHGSKRFARLAFSRREAQAIAALRPPNPVTTLLDFDASKQLFTSERLAKYGVLHISTHGLANVRDANRSALVFSLVDSAGSPLDGMLTAAEVSALQLNASVVVLNACDTTLGQSFAGEGPLSLARAFLYAGADRVIGTRWQIDDEASAALLTAFYRSMWQDGLSPSAALRRAQLAIRSDLRWRSPFYWASFLLLGEP
jgi:CHAT domain-containing protein/Tfp pilus assembly protein PilF